MKPKGTTPQARKTKNTPILGLTLTLLPLILSGCVVQQNTPPKNNEIQTETSEAGTEPPTQEREKNKEIIASSVSSASDIGADLQIDIYALERVGDNLLRLRLGITNNSDEDFYLYAGFADSENPYTASRITLIDAENQTRHLSYNQSDGSCFCLPFEGSIKSKDTVDTWVIYPAPPKDIKTMTVVTPLTPPLLDVPINDSSEKMENQGLSEPEIRDLTMISDNTEDQTGRSENSDEVSIILSSDILFETNSARLNPEAQEILEQVAIEISSANSSTVDIDGHADSTGNESINLPLSKERAEAVESVLSELITREGITFNVKGHGASDPIANNDTEEGRERNRRVSVTFEK